MKIPLLSRSLLAFYDPISHIIQIDFMDREEWKNKGAEEDALAMIRDKRYRILYHESRHYQDFIGTLWGANFQVKKYNCFAEALNYPKHKCETINDFFSVYNKIGSSDALILDTEYKYEEGKVWNVKVILSTESPRTVRVSLEDTERGKILDQELSIISLLEANAIAEELMFIGFCQQFIKDPIQLKIEENIFQAEMLRLLHSIDSFEYSIVGHLVALHLPKYDWIRCTLASTTLANLCLNIDDNLIDKIPINKMLSNFNIESNDLKKDIGLLLYNLLLNYLSMFNDSKRNIVTKDLLVANNLPEEDELLDYIFNKFDEITASVNSNQEYSGLIVNDLEIGKVFLNRRKISGMYEPLQKTIGQNMGIISRFMFGDDYWDINVETLYNKNVLKMNIGEWWTVNDQIKETLAVLEEDC